MNFLPRFRFKTAKPRTDEDAADEGSDAPNGVYVSSAGVIPVPHCGREF